MLLSVQHAKVHAEDANMNVLQQMPISLDLKTDADAMYVRCAYQFIQPYLRRGNWSTTLPAVSLWLGRIKRIIWRTLNSIDHPQALHLSGSGQHVRRLSSSGREKSHLLNTSAMELAPTTGRLRIGRSKLGCRVPNCF